MVCFLLSGCDLWYQVFPNDPPVADAGVDQPAITDSQFILDGTGSYDPDNDTISYTWFFWGAPVGSSALLYNYTTSQPFFTPDIDGDYVFILIVDDGYIESKPDSVTITAN